MYDCDNTVDLQLVVLNWASARGSIEIAFFVGFITQVYYYRRL